MNILWIIIIGFVAGIIARLLAPGPNNPTGFILTTVLGIVGAFMLFPPSSDKQSDGIGLTRVQGSSAPSWAR